MRHQYIDPQRQMILPPWRGPNRTISDQCNKNFVNTLLSYMFDVDRIYIDWGRPLQRRILKTTPKALGTYNFLDISMGIKAIVDVTTSTRVSSKVHGIIKVPA